MSSPARQTFPTDLKEAARSFSIHGLDWWIKVMIPGIFPYYVTGALTASGGSWNAAIVAEYVKAGDHTEVAQGIGSYIAKATEKGNFQQIVLGVVVMSDLRHRLQPAIALAAAVRPRRTPVAPLRLRITSMLQERLKPLLDRRGQSLIVKRYRTGSGERGPLVLDHVSFKLTSKARSSACSGAPAAASPRCCASSSASRFPRKAR